MNVLDFRKAVVSYRASTARTSGSFASRHHLAISHAYLDAAAILAGNAGSAGELAQCLDLDIFDIKKLPPSRAYVGFSAGVNAIASGSRARVPGCEVKAEPGFESFCCQGAACAELLWAGRSTIGPLTHFH